MGNINVFEYGTTNYNQTFEYKEQLKLLNSILSENGNTRFRDKDFEPDNSNLISDDENNIFIEGVNREKLLQLRRSIGWLEIEKIYNTKNVNLFYKNDRITPHYEIFQGLLGNSHLIASLGALISSRPQIIREMFEIPTYNKKGILAIRLIIQGEATLIFIDEFFPAVIKHGRKPAFSYCKNKEIWVAAIEKAWTKAHGKCYTKNYIGTPYEAFNCFVFAPTYFYYHKKYISRNRIDLIWNKLLEAKAKKHAICANTEEISDQIEFQENRENETVLQGNSFVYLSNINLNVDQSSNMSNHVSNSWIDKNQAFAVLDIFEFEEVKLIKIWSPRETLVDWSGEYAHNSENWSRELIDHIKYKKENGVFYATFEEYIKHFVWTYVCKNEDNFLYRSLKSKLYHQQNSYDQNNLLREEMNIIRNEKNIINAESNMYENRSHEVNINEEKINIYNNNNIENFENPESIRKFLSDRKSQVEKFGNSNQDEKIRLNEENDNHYENYDHNDAKKGNLKKEKSNRAHIIKPTDIISLKEKKSKYSSKIAEKLPINDERNWIKSLDIFACSFSIGDIPSHCYITLHQPSILSFTDFDGLSDYRPPLAFFIISKFQDGQYTFIGSEMVNWEKLTIEVTLEKGEYHVFGKSYWNNKQPYNLVISSYSDSILDLNPLDLNLIPQDWLSQILSNMGIRSPNREYPCYDEPTSFSSNLMFDNNNFSGFCLYYYENASKEGLMSINLNFKKLHGFKILNLEHLLKLQGSEYSGNLGENNEDIVSANIVFKIPPGTSVVVILQVIELPWLCSLDWYHDIWFEYSVEVMINKMRKADTTDKILLDRNGLYLYEMEHERGIIILIENLTNSDYSFDFEITTLKNLVLNFNSDDIKRSNNEKNLEFITQSKGITILNFSIIKSPKEFPFKIRYIYKFWIVNK